MTRLATGGGEIEPLGIGLGADGAGSHIVSDVRFRRVRFPTTGVVVNVNVVFCTPGTHALMSPSTLLVVVDH